MAIHGITDSRIAEYPVLGHLRKGLPKGPNSIGKDLLDHFRLEAAPHVMRDFTKTYGEKPNYLRVWLAYPPLEQDGQLVTSALERNLDSWMKQHAGGKLMVQCDRYNIVRQRKNATSPLLDCAIPCPGRDNNGCGKCRADTKLYVFMDGLLQYGLQVVVVHSTSINDAIKLAKHLKQIQEDYGTIVGIPMILYRKAENISRGPVGGRTDEWLLNLTVPVSFSIERAAAYLPFNELFKSAAVELLNATAESLASNAAPSR